MADDYPAAHSMDTTWFAIDDRGQVAAFWSGENGPVPGGGAEWEELDALLNGGGDDYPGHGVAHYGYTEEYGGLLRLYVRGDLPAAPLHVDQLPPRLRDAVAGVRFRGARFDLAERLQPVQYFACTLWSPGGQVAYLMEDGVTVRPVPGQEEAFAELAREWPPYYTVEGLRFEGPTG